MAKEQLSGDTNKNVVNLNSNPAFKVDGTVTALATITQEYPASSNRQVNVLFVVFKINESLTY